MKKNVMIIDDSALMRRVLSDIINQTEQYQVIYAAVDGKDGLDALHRLPQVHFIFLDINMPNMGGVELLKIMKRERMEIPVVVFSTIAERSSAETIEALSLGAVDFLKKPENILANRSRFQKKVMERLSILESANEPSVVVKGPARKRRDRNSMGRGKLVAIACSTGGPRALHEVIPYLPSNLDAPVLVVQHMPEGFTESLASRLNDISKIPVTEAKDGERLENGHVYIAKGGRHLRIVQDRGYHVIQLGTDPPVSGLRPYANYMYESLVQSDYYEIICVVLTGMGADGTQGIGTLSQEKNVYVISQDRESSTVYGMPKMIAQSGLSDEILSLNKIAKAITNYTGVC
ncbi:MAG: chemotaxis-specific protein-glutamate methyltransferase CheB [Bacteroides sp.]|nr:chemotaxis-specific protein-glutamate methyltransferase CheB [Bacteroides sp.]MCM1550033.1 chemotaxis-specific protein-glutamate methyltransferase CheB [Clostridium sp.]